MPLSSFNEATSSSGPQASRGTRLAASHPPNSSRSYNPTLDPGDQSDVQSQENTVPTGTSLPLTPYPGSAPQLPGSFSGSLRAGYTASNFVRTALSMLMQSNILQPPSSGLTVPNPLASTLARDSLLIYAHKIFNSFSVPGSAMKNSHEPADVTSPDHPYNSQLLPLLQRLRTLHPEHLPTLLLLGCALYAVGNYKESLAVNEDILQIDANFVEAMSNIGTTLNAMGRQADAIQWWWKAVNHRPYYWDAVNNLLGALVAEEQSRQCHSLFDRKYAEPLRLCETIQTRLLGNNGEFLVSIAPRDLHHLQNIFYVSGSIRCLSGHASVRNGLRDFTQAIEVLLHVKGPGATTRYNFRHLLLAGCLGGLVVSSSVPESIAQLAQGMGYATESQVPQIASFDLLEFARNADDGLWRLIIAEGDGTFPPFFASPQQTSNLTGAIFKTSFGVFPSLCTWSEAENRLKRPPEDVASKGSELASNILLSIAKVVQESKSATVQLPRFDHLIHVGSSLSLLLCYLAFAVFPSPSACNNLGIILSTTPWMDAKASDAYGLARAYYEKGLELDPGHAHLLTNMGSLLKEAGQIMSAVEMYTRAVQANPTFDIALANLANALKDLGRLPESLAIYRKAIAVNSELPEALCGLAHTAWSICDWRGFGHTDPKVAIDTNGNLDRGSTRETGLMPKLILMTQRQLSAAYEQNVGLVKTIGSMEHWIAWIEESVDMNLSDEQRRRWISYLQPFFDNPEERVSREGLNEGSFVIRVVEWLTRHLQWRWFIDAFGSTAFQSQKLPVLDMNAIRHTGNIYNRPQLPPSASLPLMPSVLPFHTFIYPLSAREIRLVAHRNAARVSHSTLTCSWLPEYVYPPPPPPGPKINVGYVSSDFADHPTAHLISSIFGMHDRTKFSVFAYATSVSDGSAYRAKIEEQVETFRDVSTWTTQAIVEGILKDEIHILVNLNGYTKGARNDIFAARPCPVQISFLGFAGTLASGWCDYLICDRIACPPSTRACELCDKQGSMPSALPEETSNGLDYDLGPDPESMAEWKYIERLIYMPRDDNICKFQPGMQQSSNKALALTPIKMYKFDPSIFATWLRILKRVPNSVLWLLRFPPAGEEHLLRTASQWAGPEIASRVRLTDVAVKDEHIERARVADIFLDTVECNAHTVAADVIWGGIPIITWPKYTFKMCSRAGASIASATGFGSQMVVDSLKAYEERADTSKPGKDGSAVEPRHISMWKAVLNTAMRDVMALFGYGMKAHNYYLACVLA
ncbi:TPR-like protein [Sanghuangporus baumii]|uniref:protein O-GlcNAc transferase n=1 Tax=Sanghuangporus baumii TaxID=108892 RepID=A0A9Q5NC59_SANBA|nr:TPR-like protein [Sanghuangporus baumii]